MACLSVVFLIALADTSVEWSGSIGGALVGGILVAGSIAFYGWLLKSVMRSGGRVETSAYGGVELFVAGAWLGIFGLMTIGSGGGAEETFENGLAVDELLQLAGLQLAIYAIPFAVLAARKHNPASLFGLNAMPATHFLLWGFTALVAFLPVLGAVSTVLYAVYGGAPPEQDVMRMVRNASGGAAATAMIVFAVVLAPVCEEFFFRGLLYGSAKRFFGAPAAAIASSAAFALVHGHIPAFVPLFLLSIAFVLSYERTGSLLVPMTMHALFNATSLVASRFVASL